MGLARSACAREVSARVIRLLSPPECATKCRLLLKRLRTLFPKSLGEQRSADIFKQCPLIC